MENNMRFKEYAKKKGVRLWEVAVRLGISEATITRWLRVPLPGERENVLYEAVQELIAEKERGYCP